MPGLKVSFNVYKFSFYYSVDCTHTMFSILSFLLSEFFSFSLQMVLNIFFFWISCKLVDSSRTLIRFRYGGFLFCFVRTPHRWYLTKGKV